MKNALIVVPHEDDLEILCYHIVSNLIKNGYKVIELVMTDGRYGTKNKAFSGERLKKIRKKEVLCAAKAFGTNSKGEDNVSVDFMNYCDGYVPFNRDSISLLREKFLKYNPIVSVGFDPFFGLDLHHDHIQVGRNYFFALKSLDTEKRPKLMLFAQSFKNDWFIKRATSKMLKEALSCYKSQISPMGITFIVYGMGLLSHLLSSLKRGRFSSGYRQVQFNQKKNTLIKIRDLIKYRLIFSFGPVTTEKEYHKMYIPLPDFTLKSNQNLINHFDTDLSKKLSSFYFGKQIKHWRINNHVK